MESFPRIPMSSLSQISAHNLHTARHHALSEISGSLGDLGTFLPIALTLAANNTISLSSTLIFSGLFNILTGLFFGIPLPVQPMKAIAAVAIAQSFRPAYITAAGVFVGACILLFSISGLLPRFSSAIPIPVIKGIQVGAGLSLITAAGSDLKALVSYSWIDPYWSDNGLMAFVAFLFLLASNIYRRIPYALLVTLLGLLIALITSPHLPSFSIWRPSAPIIPRSDAWEWGGLNAGLGQLPLTTLNSIIAVTHLAADLLPDVPTPSTTAIGLSVAAMNLTGCWFGAMPVCHGSGGLAAQYRFGARSGASVIFLGAVKLILGLFFGETLVELLGRFPTALLGVMVIAAGLELVSVGEALNTSGARDLGKRDGDGGEEVEAGEVGGVVVSEEERKRRWMVMMVTVGMLVGFKNDAVGFVAGLLCHWGYEVLPRVVERMRGRRGGGVRLE